MRTYLTVYNDGVTVPGWATGTARYYLRENGGTCSDDDAAFNAAVSAVDALPGLTYAQKMAQIITFTLAAPPAAAAGKRWVARECGAQEEDLTVTANPADFVDDGGGGTDPGASDPNAETDVQTFTSESENDGGNFS